MASAPIRDQVGDHLITPQNAALVLIDYQPSQFGTVRSMDQDLLRKNIVSTVETARAFGACRPGRGCADRLGLARVRAAARLESAGDRAAGRPDRAHRETVEGMT
jgi:hypothetical protein